jgi:hypothetical protein
MLLASGEFTGSESWWFLLRHVGPIGFFSLLLVIASFLTLLFCVFCGHRVHSFFSICAVLGLCYFTFTLSADIPVMKTFPPAALGPTEGDVLAVETQGSIIAFIGCAATFVLYVIFFLRNGLAKLLLLFDKL